MSNRSRLIIFLLASFASALGDTLLVFSVPIGLGLETKDLRATVLMWLIPAIAVFCATFLHRHVANQFQNARRNYSIIVLTVAVFEVAVSLLALHPAFNGHVILLISIFIFGYAFIKEGIPRLLYVVSVYNYFCDPKDYSKIAGLSAGLNILAGLVGALLASVLLYKGSWKVALIIDALTFIGLGLALLFAGRDPQFLSDADQASEKSADASDKSNPQFNWILLAVTIVPIVDCLVVNYIPLLGERYAMFDASVGVAAIALLRLPGMLAGLQFRKVVDTFSLDRIIKILPILYFVSGVLFISSPTAFSFCILLLLQGLMSGVYWPADYSIRNTLGHRKLVAFNTEALRRLVLFQALSCLTALALFHWKADLTLWTPVAILVFATASASVLLFRTRKLKLLKVVLAASILMITAFSLKKLNFDFKRTRKVVTLLIPSVSQDLTLRRDLTFAAFSILNDVNLHFVKLSSDLTINPDGVKSYERLDDGRTYVLRVNREYSSFSGETIDAYDLAFTIKKYLATQREIAAVLTSIKGSDSCKSIDCEIAGISVIDESTLRIELAEPDEKFVVKLANPWLTIAKKDKALVESIGSCKVPYQLGAAKVINCDHRGVLVRFKDQDVLVTKDKATAGAESLTIVNDNPGMSPSPTLTVLTVFLNPNSSKFDQGTRVKLTEMIRFTSRSLAESLQLRWSPLLTSKWLAVSAPEDFLNPKKPEEIACPTNGIKILLDSSLPNQQVIEAYFTQNIKCKLSFTTTEADLYFDKFRESDIGVAWFSPDYLDLYNSYAEFDCHTGSNCYFNWNDKTLQAMLDKLRLAGAAGDADKAIAMAIERVVRNRGYAAPIAEMNWWLKSQSGYKAIHPAGLGQISLSDFL